MISFVETEEKKDLVRRLCEKTPFGCKIASVVGAYGFEKGFACFWVDDREQTVFCLADDVMILSGTVQNAEEARGFLDMVRPGAISCAVKNAEILGLSVAQSGDILTKAASGPAVAVPRPLEEVPIREIFTLLEEVRMVEDFEPFYLDLSHKLRHGAARAYWRMEEGELAGCAVVSSLSETGAILSALAVREPFRRRGIGTDLVRQVEADAGERTVFVFREKEANAAFYRGLGFRKTDTWTQAYL